MFSRYISRNACYHLIQNLLLSHSKSETVNINLLTPNDLQKRRAVSRLKIKIPSKYVSETQKINQLSYSFSLLIIYGSS
jgi:hypothetical protein